jgi:hypothetical protein
MADRRLRDEPAPPFARSARQASPAAAQPSETLIGAIVLKMASAGQNEFHILSAFDPGFCAGEAGGAGPDHWENPWSSRRVPRSVSDPDHGRIEVRRLGIDALQSELRARSR